MREQTTADGNAMGPELHNEIQRLICEWRGCDAADQDAALPALVERIVQLKYASITRAATHDGAEAA